MSDGLARLYELHSLLLKLVDLARNEAWDDLLMALPPYQALTANLPQLAMQDLPDAARRDLSERLQQMQLLQDELSERTEVWRDELATHLQGLHNSGKLDKAYRS